jgi:hypothetical protein
MDGLQILGTKSLVYIFFCFIYLSTNSGLSRCVSSSCFIRSSSDNGCTRAIPLVAVVHLPLATVQFAAGAVAGGGGMARSLVLVVCDAFPSAGIDVGVGVDVDVDAGTDADAVAGVDTLPLENEGTDARPSDGVSD